MSQRISHLGEAARRIASGHFDDPIEPVDDVEFDPLIEDLNAMRERLRGRVALQVEQAELEKALELGAAVQRMCLSSASHIEHAQVRAGFAYQPATTCGGDFWFGHVDGDGRLLVFVGDVTGHGSASAVVTAAVSAQIRMQLAREDRPDVSDLLLRLNESLLHLCRGSYCMTMAVLEIDPAGRLLRYHSAGAPPVLLCDGGGRSEAVTLAGTPLGMPRFCAAQSERSLREGMRIHVFTDGVLEAERGDGRAFGLRRLIASLGAVRAAPLERACEGVLDAVREFVAGAPQNDDWTMVVLEVA